MTGQGCLDGGSLKKHWVPVDHMSVCLEPRPGHRGGPNPKTSPHNSVSSQRMETRVKGKNGSDLCAHMHIELAEDRVPGTSSSVPH